MKNNLILSDITYMFELILDIYLNKDLREMSRINSPKQLTHTFGVRKLWAH